MAYTFHIDTATRAMDNHVHVLNRVSLLHGQHQGKADLVAQGFWTRNDPLRTAKQCPTAAWESLELSWKISGSSAKSVQAAKFCIYCMHVMASSALDRKLSALCGTAHIM